VKKKKKNERTKKKEIKSRLKVHIIINVDVAPIGCSGAGWWYNKLVTYPRPAGLFSSFTVTSAAEPSPKKVPSFLAIPWL
jgi:hypothetical protein